MENSCSRKTCCCNCKNQLELFKHPWNIVNKGSILDSTKMFACIVPFDMDSKRRAIIFEKEHGECELYISINK